MAQHQKAGFPNGCNLEQVLNPNLPITSIAWSPDGKHLASASQGSIHLWDMRWGAVKKILEGQNDLIVSLAWSRDSKSIASVSQHGMLSVWHITDSQPIKQVSVSGGNARCLAWSKDGRILATAGEDGFIKLWTAATADQRHILTGQKGPITTIEWSPDSHIFAAGGSDGTIYIWNVNSLEPIAKLAGYISPILALAWSKDGHRLVSGRQDGRVLIWDVHTTEHLFTIEGHTNAVSSLSFNEDGSILASRSLDGTIRLCKAGTWDFLAHIPLSVLSPHACIACFHPTRSQLAAISTSDTAISLINIDRVGLFGIKLIEEAKQYSNAKIVLVGESGVGKTALAHSLMAQPFVPTESSHSQTIYELPRNEIPRIKDEPIIQEIVLWDLAGQPGYRLLHRLHLHDVAIGLVVFDARNDVDPFAGVGYWAEALDEASRGSQLVKFLVASRSDRGGLQANRERISETVQRYGFVAFFETSAKTKDGIDMLLNTIRQKIQWAKLATITGPALFQNVKDLILNE